jgi:hypothetical protein
MNKQDEIELKKKFNLAKLWNEILGENDSEKPKEAPVSTSVTPAHYFNLDNYVSRLNLMMINNPLDSNDSISGQEMEFAESIIKNPVVNAYLTKEQERASKFLPDVKKKQPHAAPVCEPEEIILDISEENKLVQANKSPAKPETKPPEAKDVETMPLINEKDQTTIVYDSQFDINTARDLFVSIKSHLVDNNADNLKSSLIELFATANQQMIKLVSTNLVGLDTFSDTDDRKLQSDVKIKLGLKESNVSMLASSLIEINTTTTVLSYTTGCLFLKSIMCDYILLSLYSDEKSRDVEKVLSRKMVQLCSNVYKEFTKQFIYSCLMTWIMKVNVDSGVQSNKGLVSSNKLLFDFVTKFIKDYFAQAEALIVLTSLLNEYWSVAWYDNLYAVIACLIDKQLNLSVENLGLLLNKMKNDSVNLSKSNVFSKLVLNVLNKCQSLFLVQQNQEGEVETKPAADEEAMDQDNLYGFSQPVEVSQGSQVTNRQRIPAKTDGRCTFSRNANASHLISTLESIIANNQTLMKATLSRMVLNFKSD